MRYKVTISYNGAKYAGFQSQKNALAIQDVIEGVLKTIFNEEIKIVMSSRTDAGVHAMGQVFHFDSDKKVSEYRLKGGMNGLLPKDIYVKKVEYVDESFHARYSVKNKTYQYIINTGEYDVFLNGYAYQCFYKLDVEKMREASKLYLGTHDFSSFNTSDPKDYPNQVRTILKFDIKEKKDRLIITVTGTGFLRNMVRIMVGTLIDIGRGQKTMKEFKEMFDKPVKGTRRFNADPNGLYLVKIKY